MHSKKIIIAIDGYSSSGKSTMARTMAHNIGYRYIDSGAMYRAVTLYALLHGYIDADGNIDTDLLEKALPGMAIDFIRCNDGTQHTHLNGQDVEHEIRSMQVSQHVSPIAAIPAVRNRLTALQQEFGRQRGIVMDGRDIGTTVFPDAEMKVYVDAPAETRAMRRFNEMRAAGNNTVTYDEVLANVRERDFTDLNRKQSPLRKAPDAITLDNSNMTLQQQEQWLMDKLHQILYNPTTRAHNTQNNN